LTTAIPTRGSPSTAQRISGIVRLDKDDPTKNVVDFKLYPAGSMTPPIDEDGKVSKSWLVTMANHTLVCFHSKNVTPVGDDKLTATGTLTLTRVDRNVELTPNEAYSGPVFGPPIIHRISRDATFLFLLPASGSGPIVLTGSTEVHREDFPQLVTANASEDYAGAKCTGQLVDDGSSLPEAPSGVNKEDYPGPASFNSVVGQHLDIRVHLRLAQAGSSAAKAGE
jgi:hypothetical protein